MTHNIALLQQVTDWLAAGAPHVQINANLALEGFNYSSWVQQKNECGTMCCIAGAVVEFAYADTIQIEPPVNDAFEPIFIIGKRVLPTYLTGSEAEKLLGLTQREGALLFTPFDVENEDLPSHLYDPELEDDDQPFDWTRGLAPEKVAVVVQAFIDTGDIDWNLVAE